MNRDSAITFKQQLENLCDEREDLWGNEVTARLSGIIDLHAADAQYHVPSYNRFRFVSVTRPSITDCLEEALRSVLSIMAENANESRPTSVMSCLCSTSRDATV